jgi:hypothetical protein
MRRTAAAVLAGALCVMLVACTSPPPSETPTPKPSYTTVPTTSPTPQPGVDVPLASTTDYQIGYPVYFKVYDAGVWTAQEGCACSAPGTAGELYPVGTTVWAVRIELIANKSWSNGDDIDAAAMTWGASWGPGAPVPVEAREGEQFADKKGVGWGFPSVQTPAVFPAGETRTFLMTVYVPRGAVDLELNLTVQPTATQYYNNGPSDVDLDVAVPQSVIDVMYAGNHND